MYAKTGRCECVPFCFVKPTVNARRRGQCRKAIKGRKASASVEECRPWVAGCKRGSWRCRLQGSNPNPGASGCGQQALASACLHPVAGTSGPMLRHCFAEKPSRRIDQSCCRVTCSGVPRAGVGSSEKLASASAPASYSRSVHHPASTAHIGAINSHFGWVFTPAGMHVWQVALALA